MVKKCPNCGAEIPEDATKCFVCKQWIQENNETDKPPEFLVTLLFAWFLGCFGVHRFYSGHFLTGTIQLFTLGCFGIWTYIDFILICFNKFKDSKGRLLRDYDKNTGIAMFVVALVSLAFVAFLVSGLILAILYAGQTK